jgi:hypothetical protein
MALGEAAEVQAVRVRGHVVRDQFHPGPRDGVVVLLRRLLVRRDLPDPAADRADRVRHPVSPHRVEGQVDVLPVAELPARPGDPGQDCRQLRIVRAGGVARTRRRFAAGHQLAACRAATTA